MADKQFEISVDVTGKLLLRNLCHNLNKSWGVYKKLLPKEEFNLRPGSGMRAGSLEFHVERFNTGIVSEKGSRAYQEDAYSCVHDLQIAPDFSASYYAVFDGHGGPECSFFLQKRMHIFVRRELIAQLRK